MSPCSPSPIVGDIDGDRVTGGDVHCMCSCTYLYGQHVYTSICLHGTMHDSQCKVVKCGVSVVCCALHVIVESVDFSLLPSNNVKSS